ncbi:TRAP transporter small permease subunit [Roseovarius sp. D22-M7]|uniref:TRAP transporter small permease subunit n=1 Tax=Roseovarius sp. D22-M7 TaxID=3127116 RepID=UPI003010158C
MPPEASTATALLSALRSVNRAVAIAVGLFLAGCAAFVLLDVVLRQVGASFGGTDEISGYVMAIATSWGMGYALMELGHVRIDLIRSRGRTMTRSLFDLFALATLAGTVSLIAWQAWPVVARSLANSSRANTQLETPLALVQVPWFAGWVWFAVVSWLTLVAAAMLVLRGDHAAADRAIGAMGEGEARE